MLDMRNATTEELLRIAIERVAVSLESLADSGEKLVGLLTALVARKGKSK